MSSLTILILMFVKEILFLCELSDNEIEYIIKSNGDNLDKAGMTLLNKANEAGGKDNITVLLVRV